MPYESLPVVRAVQAVLSRSSTADEAATGVLEAVGDSMGWLVGGFWVPDGDDGGLRVQCVWAARIHKGTDFAEDTRRMLGVLEFFTDVLRAPVEALLPVFDAIGRDIGEFVARQQPWAPAGPREGDGGGA